MGLLNKLFRRSAGESEKKELPWIPLTELEQLEEIVKKSITKSQIIFKYSTRCSISKLVLNQFEEDYELAFQNVDLYFLDLISYREVSDAVSYKFGVVHESPQLLVVRNGVVVAHASHGAINDMDLIKFI